MGESPNAHFPTEIDILRELQSLQAKLARVREYAEDQIARAETVFSTGERGWAVTGRGVVGEQLLDILNGECVANRLSRDSH